MEEENSLILPPGMRLFKFQNERVLITIHEAMPVTIFADIEKALKSRYPETFIRNGATGFEIYIVEN